MKTIRLTCRNMALTSLAVFIIVRAGSSALASGFHRSQEQAYSRTSHAAFQACRHEIIDDFWITVGKRANLSHRRAVKSCKQEAITAVKESWDLRRDQYDERQEVCHALGQAPYDPQIDPAGFVTSL